MHNVSDVIEYAKARGVFAKNWDALSRIAIFSGFTETDIGICVYHHMVLIELNRRFRKPGEPEPRLLGNGRTAASKSLKKRNEKQKRKP